MREHARFTQPRSRKHSEWTISAVVRDARSAGKTAA